MCSLVNIAFTFHADSDRIRSLWNEMLSGECVKGRKKIQYTYLHEAISISRFYVGLDKIYYLKIYLYLVVRVVIGFSILKDPLPSHATEGSSF